MVDPHVKAQCDQTARAFARLCALRRVEAVIAWNAAKGEYMANNEYCGPSVHGLYAWLARQPGALP